MTIARVTLPWPSTDTSPNGQHGHWAKKAAAAKEYRMACWAACKAAGLRTIEADRVDVTIVFCPPSRRKMDLDNALARVKRGLDAVAEVIGVDDSQWRSMTLERGDPCKDGAVMVYINAAP